MLFFVTFIWSQALADSLIRIELIDKFRLQTYTSYAFIDANGVNRLFIQVVEASCEDSKLAPPCGLPYYIDENGNTVTDIKNALPSLSTKDVDRIANLYESLTDECPLELVVNVEGEFKNLTSSCEVEQ